MCDWDDPELWEPPRVNVYGNRFLNAAPDDSPVIVRPVGRVVDWDAAIGRLRDVGAPGWLLQRARALQREAAWDLLRAKWRRP